MIGAGNTAYFVGIGGIGMSALAQLYAARGVHVVGSDREASKTTALLKEKGVVVYIGHDASHMPESFDVLIYSDAVPFENAERVLARERGVPEQSYFEALGDISKDYFTIAVAGSHGKTTTTALLGKVLIDAHKKPTVVVGSIVKDFGSNFVLGEKEAPLVVEACEYNDHLLELSPTILVITNLEWDHTDYFKTFEQLKETFLKAIEALPENGVLVVNTDTAIGKELAQHASCRVVHYADIDVPELMLLGVFNKENAAAAKTAALAYDPSLMIEGVDDSLASFQGTWRRFEYKGMLPGGALVYDDYAHHPTEIETTLRAICEKFPDKKSIVAFHPHLYSRTRDLMDDFARALALADEVFIAPIYAAREESIEGVTSDVLAEKVLARGGSARAVSLDALSQALKAFDAPDVLILTMGAGDIYKVADSIVK